MPALDDTPARVAAAAHDLSAEPPQARAARPGFWHTLAQYRVRAHMKRAPRTLCSSARLRPPTIETPVERWARQYPQLYLQAFAGQ